MAHGRTIYIKGCMPAPELENLTPHPDTEIWAINSQSKHSPPWATRWSQLHGLGHIYECHGAEYFKWMSECPVRTFYLFDEQITRWPHFVNKIGLPYLPLPKSARPFPVEETIIELFGGMYKTNTFDWLIALALHEHLGISRVERIVLCGIDYRADKLWKSRREAAQWLESGVFVPLDGLEKRRVQVIADLRGTGKGDESWARASIEHHIGIARALGIKVYVPEECGLFESPWGKGALYGLTAGGHE